MDNNEKEKNLNVSAPETASADTEKKTANKSASKSSGAKTGAKKAPSAAKASPSKTGAKPSATKSAAAKVSSAAKAAPKSTASKNTAANTAKAPTESTAEKSDATKTVKAPSSKSAASKSGAPKSTSAKKSAPKSKESDSVAAQNDESAAEASAEVKPTAEAIAPEKKTAKSSAATISAKSAATKSATAKKTTAKKPAAKKSAEAKEEAKAEEAASVKTAADVLTEDNKADVGEKTPDAKEAAIPENVNLEVASAAVSSDTVSAEVASAEDKENIDADEKADADKAENAVAADASTEESAVNADKTAEAENGDTSVNADAKADGEDVENSVNADENAEAEKAEGEAKPKSKFMCALGKVGGAFAKAGKTVGRWFKRMFLGASKELTDEEKFRVEELQSPTKQIVKKFFRKPLAVISLVVLVGMFLFVFIGSAVHPLDLSYTEAFQQNLSPGYGMMTVPKKMRNKVKDISSFSNFSIGLSEDGYVYTWGKTKFINSVSNTDMEDLPSEISGGNVAFVSAGLDHAAAITNDGKVVCWGEHGNAQYGKEHNLTDSMVILQPDLLINGNIDVNNVKQLVCGYQVTAIVMKSGRVYCWGNFAAGANNMKQFRSRKDIDKIVFMGSRMAALLKDGTVFLGNAKSAFDTMEVPDGNGGTKFISLFDEYLAGRKVVDIVATYGSLALITEDGELIVTGNLPDDVSAPTLSDGETIVKLSGGAKHYTMLTSSGRLYSFGSNALGQCDAYKKKVSTDSEIFACAFQNYLTLNGKVKETWGLKGYLFGTDGLGRDIFARIINGGRITMTIGAVAVIISTVIAVIIGVLSGYFGGKVDMFLMRLTEVFGAIPFLPFALILSAVMAGSAISELTRMFIIMVILGILSWTGLARMVRGQVLAEREKEFVTAARAMGVKESKIAFRHILPNIISVILVSVTLDFAGCMLTEASLSYLGFGVRLPKPTWGNMLNSANNAVVIKNYWWQWLFPSLFLLVTTIAINLIGDALRDVMDPKSSSER